MFPLNLRGNIRSTLSHEIDPSWTFRQVYFQLLMVENSNLFRRVRQDTFISFSKPTSFCRCHFLVVVVAVVVVVVVVVVVAAVVAGMTNTNFFFICL